jgi:hypothetical protein
MPLKFRLSGLAETFVDQIRCPKCGHDGGEGGDQGFRTELTRVTFDGIVVVIQCDCCSYVFLPEGQRLGVIDPRKLRSAVEKDSSSTGQPILPGIKAVRLEVERINAERGYKIH